MRVHPPSRFVRCLFLVVALVGAVPLAAAQPVQTDLPALHEVYRDHFQIGTLLSYPHIGLPGDPVVPGQSPVVSATGGELIRHHMNSMGPGNNMKPQYTIDMNASAQAYQAAPTQAARDSIDVHPVVRFNGNLIAQLNWAQRQGFVFRGHTLVWHSQTPGTGFFRQGYSATGERLSPERMTQRMGHYIREVIRLLHEGWPGLVVAMDVVNETVLEDGRFRTDNNEWYTTYGDFSYVARAFEFARQHSVAYGETQMKLYYNDYNTHFSGKADGIVRLMRPIYEAGFSDGIGMQQHDGWNSPSAQQWLAAYAKYATVSDEIAVTELDVNPAQTTPTAQRLQEQANQYAMFFKLFMDHSAGSGRGKIVNVTKDGLNDQYAFVANASLWDSANQAKPAYYAVADVGRYYNALDTLFAYVDALDEATYDPASWDALTSAYASAQTAKNGRTYSYFLSAADGLRTAYHTLLASVDQLVPVSAEDAPLRPRHAVLAPNYPNPFTDRTTFQVLVPTASTVRLDVFDVLGRQVATVVDAWLPAGWHEATFTATELPSGVYVARLRVGDATRTQRLQVVR